MVVGYFILEVNSWWSKSHLSLGFQKNLNSFLHISTSLIMTNYELPGMGYLFQLSVVMRDYN